MSIYVTGSIAYDRIMKFSGQFNKSIMPEHLDILNVSFFIDQLDEKLGGVAGNIAYSLYLLGEQPFIVACAGKDFSHYKEALKKRRLPLNAININNDELTASCYIITDTDNNQITAFHAAAHKFPCTYSFPNLNPKVDLAIIGPTNPDDMLGHAAFFKTTGVRYIFDPSQQLPVLPAEKLLEAIEGAYLLVGNEYEIKLITETTGSSQGELLTMTQAGVIITQGEKGSLILEKGKDPVAIPAVGIEKVEDPTGAGDSYRAGLIKGIALGTSLPVAASLGATCASFCVENKGTQAHFFTHEKFKERYEKTFGENSFPFTFVS